MRKQNQYVTLERWVTLDRDVVYTIIGLRNTASVLIGFQYFRLGDELTEAQADKLCDLGKYDVSIRRAGRD